MIVAISGVMETIIVSELSDTLDLYTFATPNGRKISIMLEEAGWPYRVHRIDIERGDQRAPSYVVLNPNGKIPVLVDQSNGRTLFESGAILLYLTERTGTFVPAEGDRFATYQWLFFQAAHIGPMLGQLWHFTKFASEPVPLAIDRYSKEGQRLFRVLDSELSKREFLVGSYGVADIANWTWIDAAVRELDLTLTGLPHLGRWHAAIGARPAVVRGAAIPKIA